MLSTLLTANSSTSFLLGGISFRGTLDALHIRDNPKPKVE